MNLLYDVIHRFYLASLNTEPIQYNDVEVTAPKLLAMYKAAWLSRFFNAPKIRIYTQFRDDKPCNYYMEYFRPEYEDWSTLSTMNPKDHPTLAQLLQYHFDLYPKDPLLFIRGEL